MKWVLQIRSPPPLPISLIPQRLFFFVTPVHGLTPIELIYRELFNSCRTVFNRVMLLVPNNVRVDP